MTFSPKVKRLCCNIRTMNKHPCRMHPSFDPESIYLVARWTKECKVSEMKSVIVFLLDIKLKILFNCFFCHNETSYMAFKRHSRHFIMFDMIKCSSDGKSFSILIFHVQHSIFAALPANHKASFAFWSLGMYSKHQRMKSKVIPIAIMWRRSETK